jgi:hypothetical protein
MSVDLKRRMALAEKMKGACFQVPFIKYNKHLQDVYLFLSTLSFSSLPTLKKGSFLGSTLIFVPVLGFLPV